MSLLNSEAPGGREDLGKSVKYRADKNNTCLTCLISRFLFFFLNWPVSLAKLVHSCLLGLEVGALLPLVCALPGPVPEGLPHQGWPSSKGWGSGGTYRHQHERMSKSHS